MDVEVILGAIWERSRFLTFSGAHGLDFPKIQYFPITTIENPLGGPCIMIIVQGYASWIG